MTKKPDAPAIRFKGFSDAWEQRKLTEFVEFFSGLTYTPNDVQENGTLVLRSSNVSNGEVVDADNIYVNPQVVNSENVKVGDIVVVVRNGSRSLIGKHAQIKAFMPNTVIGAFMTGIRSECPEFTNALLNTSRFEEEIAMNMGATINQITGYMFSKMEFKVPCLDEQKKIGEYFEKLDNLITLHQRKFEKLTNVKKSMLEKMFPQNGCSYPEIRFKGFTDAWEQRKLSEMCGTFEYGLNAAAKEFDGKNKYIRITDIDDASREFLLSDLSSPDICLDGMSKYLLSSGDIVFARTGASVGKTYIYRENDGIVYFAGFLIRAKVNQDNDAEFVFQSTLSPSYEKYIRITSQRSGQPGVNAQEYGEYDLFAPSKEEQQRIGHFLRGIDNLITLHQRELEKLQNIKKSMLEKMFVYGGTRKWES